MKIATYTGINGKKIKVEYDEKAPCIWCGLPVENASMGGTNLCPACDCGVYRDGTKWTYKETMNQELVRKKAKEIYEKLIKEKNDQNSSDRGKFKRLGKKGQEKGQG